MKLKWGRVFEPAFPWLIPIALRFSCIPFPIFFHKSFHVYGVIFDVISFLFPSLIFSLLSAPAGPDRAEWSWAKHIVEQASHPTRKTRSQFLTPFVLSCLSIFREQMHTPQALRGPPFSLLALSATALLLSFTSFVLFASAFPSFRFFKGFRGSKGPPTERLSPSSTLLVSVSLDEVDALSKALPFHFANVTLPVSSLFFYSLFLWICLSKWLNTYITTV